MTSARATQPLPKRAVLVGNFDGVHKGHQTLITQARAWVTAKQPDALVAALTFEPHPAAVLGRTAPPQLTPLWRKEELLRAAGADEVIVEPFTHEFSRLGAEAFALDYLRGALGTVALLVGHDFHFGRNREGNLDTLRALAGRARYAVLPVAAIGDATGVFSSTRVRKAIAAGDLADARAVLGRLPTVSGVVQHGDKRGRTLGFPTANLGTPAELLPPRGVYAAWVEVALPAGASTRDMNARRMPAVLNIGVRPTVGTQVAPTVEVHVLDQSADWYGATMLVHLAEQIRPEQRFADLNALTAQIRSDCQAAANVLRTGAS
jgi:riboflavin kinase/FMN adenylyltransferase